MLKTRSVPNLQHKDSFNQTGDMNGTRDILVAPASGLTQYEFDPKTTQGKTRKQSKE